MLEHHESVMRGELESPNRDLRTAGVSLAVRDMQAMDSRGFDMFGCAGAQPVDGSPVYLR
jgi:hypothetical protein